MWDAALQVLCFVRKRRRNSVVEMTRSALFSVLGREFDDFLFAPIGEDRNDMPLSVLSALARLDIDPWQEAAELARLPRETATRRLASSIAALPDGPSAHPELGTIAGRLIALLPRQADSTIVSQGGLLDVGDATKFRAGMCMFAVLFAFMLAAQWLVASHQTPAQADTTHAPISSAVLPQSTPHSGE
jgi:hypothetical protein